MITAILNNDQSLGLDSSHIGDDLGLMVEVALAFKNMQNLAAKSGIDIQILSSFRSFDKQKSIWNGKARGNISLLDQNSLELDFAQLEGDKLMFSLLLWSAFPGSSRHHWGTDLDVYDAATIDASSLNLVQDEYYTGCCSKMFAWLQQNAADFGFFWPYSKHQGGFLAEPWHISYLPLGMKILQDYSLRALSACLLNNDVDLKSNIIANLDFIANNYIYNVNYDN